MEEAFEQDLEKISYIEGDFTSFLNGDNPPQRFAPVKKEQRK